MLLLLLLSFLENIQHFSRSNDIRSDRKVLQISCNQIRLFFFPFFHQHGIKNDVLRVRNDILYRPGICVYRASFLVIQENKNRSFIKPKLIVNDIINFTLNEFK